jgi:hypothetical protein
MRLWLGLSILALLSLPSSGAETYEPPKRSLTISSGYVERVFNSNEALVEFPISVIEGYGALFDVATSSFNHQWWSRLLISLGEVPVGYWVANSVFVPFHEFGHARAMRSTGSDYHYTSDGYGKHFQGISNYWTLSLVRLATPPFYFPGQGAASTRYRPKKFQILESLDQHYGPDGIEIIVTASGLNNQTLLAKKIASQINQGHGHITQWSHYIGNKIAGFVYGKQDRSNSQLVTGDSDIGRLLLFYQGRGYGITHRDIELQSLLSLLSGTTFTYLKGYYDYISKGDATVRPLEFYGVRWPDINSYLNANGLSLEIVSGYRHSPDLYFDLAYEFIWKGGQGQQVTPSAHFNLASVTSIKDQLWLHLETPIGNGMGGSFMAEWQPFAVAGANFWRRFSYIAQASLHNAFNLYGERNITSITNGKTLGFDGFVGLRLNY